MTNGRDGREVSRKEEEERVDWATMLRRTERGGMVGAGAAATGGGGTRACVRSGRRFSFPLTLLVNANDFFHVSAGIPSPSLGEPLSTHKKLLVNAKVAVDAASDAGRLDLDLDGCRGAAAAGP